MSSFTFPAETGTYDCVVEQEESSGLGVTYDEIVLTCRVNAFVGQGWCLSSWGDRLGCGGESGCKQKDYYPHCKAICNNPQRVLTRGSDCTIARTSLNHFDSLALIPLFNYLEDEI